jgi:hypothetical protein
VSVGEEEQADYLVRYFLLVLGTGFVERAFWWRLIARGYGLAWASNDGSLRRRPSWDALRTLIDRVEGASFDGPLPASQGAYLYRFLRDGQETIVGWSVSPGRKATLPRAAAEVVSRDGRPLAPPDSAEIELGPSPVYFLLR